MVVRMYDGLLYPSLTPPSELTEGPLEAPTLKHYRGSADPTPPYILTILQRATTKPMAERTEPRTYTNYNPTYRRHVPSLTYLRL